MALTLQGQVTSWDRCTITFGHVTQLPTISSLNYTVKVDGIEKQYGAGQIPYGRNDGNWQVDDAKVSMTPRDFYALFTGIGGKAGMLNDNVTFNMTVSYQVDPLNIVPYVDTLKDCRIVSYDTKLEQNKATMIEVTLSILDADLCQPSLNILFGLGIALPVVL
jgi:hypothetical protein